MNAPFDESVDLPGGSRCPSLFRARSQIDDDFFDYHRANPHVWELFERFTLQCIAAG